MSPRGEDMPARVALFHALSTLINAPPPPGGFNPTDLPSMPSATPLSVQALLLCALEEFSQDDAATILGISPDRVNELVEEGGKAIQSDERATVLILDSEFMVTLELMSALEAFGYRVCGTPRTSAEALERAHVHKPDIIILTSAIRFGDNLEPMRVAEDVQRMCNASLVLLTAYPERFLQGRDSEWAFIMAKPFQPIAVAALVSQALRFGRDQAGAIAPTVPRSGSDATSS